MKIRLTSVLRKETEGTAVKEVEVVAEMIEEADEVIVEGIKEATVSRVGQASIATQAICPKTATIIIQVRLTINPITMLTLTFHNILNLLVLTHNLCRIIYLHQVTYQCLHLTPKCLTIHNILSPNLITLVPFLVIIHLLVFTLLNMTIIHSHKVFMVAMVKGILKVRKPPMASRKIKMESN